MPATSDLRRWLAAHPLQADAGLALIVLLPALTARPTAGSPRMLTDLSWATFVLLLISCAVLVWRRRKPWLVWGATTGLGLVGVAVDQGPSRVMVPSIIAVYTVSTTSPARAAILAAIFSACAPVVAIRLVSGLGVMDSLAFGLVPWCGLGAVTGIAVQNQRAVLRAAQERARLAEATREDEARRRVAEERIRIARDLHDVLAHHISLINVQAGVAAHFLPSGAEQSAAALAHVREASQLVLSEVPGLLGLLRTSEDALETHPVPTLADAGQLVEMARRSGVEVTWQVRGRPAGLAPSADLAAFRVIQEALTNAARHGLGHAVLAIDHDPGGCTIEVRNDFHPVPSRDPGPGPGPDLGPDLGLDPGPGAGQHRLGLTGMRERVQAVGGELDVGPAGTEWRVRARIPGHRPAPSPGPVTV